MGGFLKDIGLVEEDELARGVNKRFKITETEGDWKTVVIALSLFEKLVSSPYSRDNFV